MIGLGDYAVQTPPGCWNTDGFRDCALQTIAMAQKTCSDQDPTSPDCNGDGCATGCPLYDAWLMATCPCDPPQAPPADAAAAAQATAPATDWTKVAMVGLLFFGAFVILGKKGKR